MRRPFAPSDAFRISRAIVCGLDRLLAFVAIGLIKLRIGSTNYGEIRIRQENFLKR